MWTLYLTCSSSKVILNQFLMKCWKKRKEKKKKESMLWQLCNVQCYLLSYENIYEDTF